MKVRVRRSLHFEPSKSFLLWPSSTETTLTSKGCKVPVMKVRIQWLKSTLLANIWKELHPANRHPALSSWRNECLSILCWSLCACPHNVDDATGWLECSVTTNTPISRLPYFFAYSWTVKTEAVCSPETSWSLRTDNPQESTLHETHCFLGYHVVWPGIS